MTPDGFEEARAETVEQLERRHVFIRERIREAELCRAS